MRTTTRRRFLAPMLLAPFGAVPAAAALATPAEGGATPAGWIVGELRAVTLGPSGGTRRSAHLDDLHRLGWLECGGQALDKGQFPELHEAIGNTWGNGQKGRFLLPDLRGFFLRGWAATSSKGALTRSPRRRAQRTPTSRTSSTRAEASAVTSPVPETARSRDE